MEMTQTDRLIIRQAGSQTSGQTGCMHGKTDKLGKEGLHGDRQTGRQTGHVFGRTDLFGKEGLHRGQVTPEVL